ncbi:dTDP-4-amino-4,6-dideoxygalactose transaminase [Diplocloster hominis]|uniref:dTDP-4-amino-4,6-dideoxygalactose transaminase n=1 Tax=Diplocloster hominis TaxID=3079010 RepID=UPI0031B9BBF0
MINFNIPPYSGRELEYIKKAIENKKICGDGIFTKKCHSWFEKNLKAQKVLLTTSGTTALEMAAILCDLHQDDEVILPSYTFSSSASSIVLTGATPVFVDIRPDTMNINEDKIEEAITDKTKAIMVVHYAGVACNMKKIMDIAHKYGLKVIEDSAQGVMSTYKGRSLGTIGDFGCLSFHETKNFSMGEGGALIINDKEYNEKAEILREKGTNRTQFFRGQVDKYTWVDYGSSYLPSELNAAYLFAQLEVANDIIENRLKLWNNYYTAFQPLEKVGALELPTIPDYCTHNAHMFYLKLSDLNERSTFISYLKANGIQSTFHYIPLHSSPAGKKFGRYHGEDKFTTKESERLVRLPLYYNLLTEDQNKVIDNVLNYFDNHKLK